MRSTLLLGIVGVGMLLASLLPWPAPTSPAAPVATPTPAISGAEHGRQLFAAKGCSGCHNHAALERGSLFFWDDGPPNLTDYQGDPAFLREWLRDPSALRPGTEMPTLELSGEEIEALIAFLRAPQE
jgi:cytochrome c2